MAEKIDGGVVSAEAGEDTEEGGLDAAVKKVREKQEDKVAHKVLEEENLPKAKRKIVVEVERADWDSRLEELFKDIRTNASIEGFRKGKVPLKLLQRRYSREATNELVEKISPIIIREYEASKQLTLYGVPSITDYQAEADKPIRITLELEVKPEIEPKDYTGLEVEVPEIKLTDDVVDQRIEDMRKQAATFEEADKELADGDAAVLDLKSVDGKGHTVEQVSGKLYENPHAELPDAVSHALFGKKAGETIEVKATDSGRELRYTITLKAVKEQKLPQIDDEFAKDLGHKNLAEMRKSIEVGIKQYIDNMVSDEAFEVLTNKLVDAHEFDVPAALKQHVEREMARSDYMYLSQTGVTPPRLRGMSTRTQYQEELDKAAETRVKGFLLIDAIGKKENIQAEDAEINAALEERGQQEGRKAVAIRAALEKRREYSQFVEQVRFNKIRSFLLEKTSVKLVEPKKEDVEEGAPDAPDKPKRASKKTTLASEEFESQKDE